MTGCCNNDCMTNCMTYDFLHSSPCDPSDSIDSKEFTRERIFEAVSQRDATLLNGLLDYLRVNKKQLTSPEFTGKWWAIPVCSHLWIMLWEIKLTCAQLSDEINGKTALLKALLKLKDGKNDTVEVLLDIAEKTGDLKKLINAPYKDPYYQGRWNKTLSGVIVLKALIFGTLFIWYCDYYTFEILLIQEFECRTFTCRVFLHCGITTSTEVKYLNASTTSGW